MLLLPFSFHGDSSAQQANGDYNAGMHYSPLTQITPANVNRLARAWTFHTGEKGRQFETLPVVAEGLLYITSQNCRVIALEPETGKEVWKYDPHVTRARDHRGVSYWPGDAGTAPRILLATGDARLIELDAKTGTVIPSFGDSGIVDLRIGVADGYPQSSYSVSSPPAIYKNLAIVGPSTPEGPSHGPSGDPRAFDIKTGKLVWRFHTVPQPGEPGNETWGPDGWKDRAGPSLWGNITIDSERGLVFLPTGNPADSWYGADRKGTNLYANSLVALDAGTGKMRWYFQMVHHDIFDYDVTGSPTLVTAKKDGKEIPAIAEITKMGLLFILDRETGKPVFGVEERPVPKSQVPGEESWPTQPFPMKPPPLARTTAITRDELSKRTPQAEKYCAEQFDKYIHGSLYTPFGLEPVLTFPGAMGGGNWGGVSFDPTLSYVFVNTSNMGAIGRMAPSPPGSPMPYRNESGYARFLDNEQYPCQQPPWGELSAVNTKTGDVAWRVPLGSYDELEARGLKNWGTPNTGGSLATAGGLLFVAATNDSRFRAFDSRTGSEIWAARLDATGNATPMSYLGRDGKQYVVVAAGGPDHLRNVGNTSTNNADALIAFAVSDHAVLEPTSTVQLTPTAQARGLSKPPVITAPVVLPEGKEKQVLMKVCNKCHGLETFSKLRMTRDEWRLVVGDMVQRGATGTSEEIQIVVDYLSRYLGQNSPISAGTEP
jgi:glucose dehydrogenase